MILPDDITVWLFLSNLRQKSFEYFLTAHTIPNQCPETPIWVFC